MATIQTNIITLALKGILINAQLTFDDSTDCIVKDYEYDPKTDIFVIEATDGNVYPVHASKIGEVTQTGATKPNGNKQKFKKLL
jgi:hypothetical protein